jgi:hypothetical protein
MCIATALVRVVPTLLSCQRERQFALDPRLDSRTAGALAYNATEADMDQPHGG